jgi:hypothetical protein
MKETAGSYFSPSFSIFLGLNELASLCQALVFPFYPPFLNRQGESRAIYSPDPAKLVSDPGTKAAPFVRI